MKKSRLKRTQKKKIHGQVLGGVSIPKGRAKPRERVEIEVICPTHFSLRNNADETLAFFKELEDLVFVRRVQSIRVNHTKTQTVDPEVALLLLAEFSRYKYHAPSLRLLGMFGGLSANVLDVLNGVGYLSQFYKEFSKSEKVKAGGRVYFRHQTGKLVTAEKANDLVDEFYKSGSFDVRGSKRLKKCLTELIDNAVSHAYLIEGYQKVVEAKKWWMLGYRDTNSGELYFAIYDQGVGMVKTLKKNFTSFGWLIPHHDEEMVLTAFEKSTSRTQEENRGLGLPKLRRYAEEARDGELFVQTRKVRCRFSPGKRPSAESHKIPLAGTMIVWKTSGELKN